MKFFNTEAQPINLIEWLPSIISLAAVFFTGGFIFGLMVSTRTIESEPAMVRLALQEDSND